MKHTQIFKTEKNAILAAKNNCIEKLEESHGITIPSLVQTDMINDSDLWLINDMSCQCDCGQTSAVHVILFEAQVPDGISPDLKEGEWSDIKGDNQYYEMAGICEVCG